jgi:hypothetical protein
MRSDIAFVVVLTGLLFGSGGRALAERLPPGASKVSTEEQQAKPVADAKQIKVEPRRGSRAAKLRRGERLAPEAVPEFDPNAAGLALGLLCGGAFLCLDRRRPQQA